MRRNINHSIYDAGQESSSGSYWRAVMKAVLNPNPFTRAKFKLDVEKILLVDIPIKRTHTSTLHLALPYSHVSHVVMGSFEHPLQLSCETKAKIPCTVIWTREGYVSELGENDPLIKIVLNDEKLKELYSVAVFWRHVISGQITMDLGWTIQVVPLGDSTLCVLETGSEWKGGMFGPRHRVYELDLRLMILEQLMDDVHRVGYSGEPKVGAMYAPIYELYRRSLSAAPQTEEKGNVCPRCGIAMAAGARVCGNCGQKL